MEPNAVFIIYAARSACAAIPFRKPLAKMPVSILDAYAAKYDISRILLSFEIVDLISMPEDQ